MAHEVEVQYTEATIRHAARCFFTRFTRRDVVIGLAGGLLALGAWLWLGLGWPYAAALGGLGLMLVVLVVLVGLANVRLAIAKFRSMGDPVVRWRFSDDSFATQSDLGSVELKWEAVSEVWRFPRVWLLFFGDRGRGYSTLPTASLTTELQDYILSRVKAHGGKVA